MMSGRSTCRTRQLEHPVSASAAIARARFPVMAMCGSSRLVVVASGRMSVAQVEPDEERPWLPLLHEVVGIRIRARRDDLGIPTRELLRPDTHVARAENKTHRACACRFDESLRELIGGRDLAQTEEISLFPVRSERASHGHCARLIEEGRLGVVYLAAVVRPEPAGEPGADFMRRVPPAIVEESR